jgi:two-component system NarL family sensor kinase
VSVGAVETANPCRTPGPHAPLAIGVALFGLAGCAVGFAIAPHDQLTSLLAVVLAACVIASSFVSLELDGTIFWSGAAIPHVCAIALLGPAPAAAITTVEEIAVWSLDRYRLRMFPINLFATVGPNIVAATAIDAGVASGPAYYVTVAVAAGGAVCLNAVLLTTLVGVFYGEPVLGRLWGHRRLIPALAVNLAVAIAAVALYRSAGMGATVFVLAGVLIFAYLMKRFALERETADRIAELATSRGNLVARLLETEDRERKALAEILHDEVIQTLVATRQDLGEVGRGASLRAPIAQIDDALQHLRGAISGTHPSVLARVGLASALTTVADFYAARGDFDVAVRVGGHGASAHDQVLFSSGRELLANAAKHGKPTSVSVAVSASGGSMILRVTDDGHGFDALDLESALTDGHIGLQSLKDRVEALGGVFEIASRPRFPGTEAVVRLPAAQPGAPS